MTATQGRGTVAWTRAACVGTVALRDCGHLINLAGGPDMAKEHGFARMEAFLDELAKGDTPKDLLNGLRKLHKKNALGRSEIVGLLQRILKDRGGDQVDQED